MHTGLGYCRCEAGHRRLAVTHHHCIVEGMLGLLCKLMVHILCNVALHNVKSIAACSHLQASLTAELALSHWKGMLKACHMLLLRPFVGTPKKPSS